MRDLQSQLAVANNLPQFEDVTQQLKERLITMAMPGGIDTKTLCDVNHFTDIDGDNDATQRNVSTVISVSSVQPPGGLNVRLQCLESDKSRDSDTSKHSADVSCSDTRRTMQCFDSDMHGADSGDSGSSKWHTGEPQSPSEETKNNVKETLEDVKKPCSAVIGPPDKYERPMWLCHCRPRVYRYDVSREPSKGQNVIFLRCLIIYRVLSHKPLVYLQFVLF